MFAVTKRARDDLVASLRGLLARAGLGWLGRRRLPQVEGTIHLSGLEGPAEVIRDRWGVPHVYADSLRDLRFAQGLFHAQDRLWQMDFNRRLVAGRLSEVIGLATVPVDRWMRTLGMRRVAEQEVSLLSGDTRLSLEAYAAGVSACIAQGRLAIEFALLRYAPQPWSVADSLSWVKMMSWQLSGNWEAELLRAVLIDRLGPELADELEPEYSDRFPLWCSQVPTAPRSAAPSIARIVLAPS